MKNQKQYSKNVSRFLSSIKKVTLPYEYGFIVGHYYLSERQLEDIKKVMHSGINFDVIDEYEARFAKLIGPGKAISFASGRMAFYQLLKSVEIEPGDEVILPAFTCSVMVNAVWRTGATPVFSNVDPETFGSCPREIEYKITHKTKVIVAQHSFGIPCKVKEIVEVARSKKLIVVEDCAITLGSKLDDVVVGNFGDAALFSTDHSKPLNTMIGGILYSNNIDLIEKVKSKSNDLPHLNAMHQNRIFQQIISERKWYRPTRYSWMRFKVYYQALLRKLNAKRPYTYLEADYTRPNPKQSPYPYPAKFPFFLAQLGNFELDRWEKEKLRRKRILKKYLTIAKDSGISDCIPAAYYDSCFEVIPLRFVYRHPNQGQHNREMSKYIDIGWTWFRSPIICCPSSLEEIGYFPGSCLLSEQVCKDIVNWPCVVQEGWEEMLVKIFGNIVN